MKIVRIETWLKNDIPVCRVHADTGDFGTGQCSTYGGAVTVKVLHEMLAPIVFGEDPLGAEAICDRVMDRTMKFPGTFVCRALSGIDTALWDLKGRLWGRPVADLLGGRVRDPVPMYASSMRRDIAPDDEAERLRRLAREQGFRAVKVRIGTGPQARWGSDGDMWPGRTEALIPEVRRAVGDEVLLLVDGNSCYTPARAIEVGQLLHEYGYCHFEEPCPYWELEWTAEVRRAIEVPVAGGEQDFALVQWRRMIDMRAVDIVQPDICYIGGLARALRVAKMAAQAEMPCVPHSANLSMVTVFTLHMMGAIPNAGPYIEFSIEPTPWAEGLYAPALEVREGKVAIPDGPGW